MRKPLSREQVREFREDPIGAMSRYPVDARDVPIAEHGDAPNPPGTDPNGRRADAVVSSERTAPVRFDPVKPPLERSGVMDESLEDVWRR
jgi:hypothetical protein